MVQSREEKSEKHYNNLKNEKSPYLIQHAQNPVDWYPWGEEAFKKAKEENKPIFLSVGYSTCHWCHVMARESFEDPKMAELINEIFIPIKVDREERPDIDCTYLAACQIITSSGGWPLTVLLTPDLKPFFAGTYYPKESSAGGIGLKELVINVQDLWQNQEDELLKSADEITASLKRWASTVSGELIPESVLERAFNFLNNIFDEHGGFGHEQKFPSANHLLYLLHYWNRTGDENALSMVEQTLMFMRRGGIWDHIGYGFHRYSMDPEWIIPHFEKMLYDQALMSLVYTEAYQATGKEEYRETVKQILEYILRDMASPEGGFYSAEDAESEGLEGEFYLWTKNEIERILSHHELRIFKEAYHIKEKGNFKDPRTRLPTGKNILYLNAPLDLIAEKLKLDSVELSLQLESIRKKLYQAREIRVHPHKDDKILTDWNGLMIAALAQASQIFDDKKYSEAALKAVEFVKSQLCCKGKLWHRYRSGEVKVPGFLDDYAFMIWGLIELYQTTLDSSLLKWASELTQELIDDFWDETDGGFYFTSRLEEDVLVRKKEAFDGSIPSGNALSYLNLLHLSTILEDSKLNNLTLELEKAFATLINSSPTGYTMFLTGLMLRLGPSYEVVIAGEKDDEATRELIQILRDNYLPEVVFSLNSADERWLREKVDSFRDKKPLEGRVTAYVCEAKGCKLPVTDSSKLLELLS
jgi:hypothetical protein